jgi:hypothetical protein
MFFTLMVGAPGSLTPPPMGVTINVLHLSGSHSQISINASQGGHYGAYYCYDACYENSSATRL